MKKAVESRALDAERFEHYRKLEREAQANELRHDEQRRRQAERVWGKLSDEVARALNSRPLFFETEPLTFNRPRQERRGAARTAR